MDIQFVLLTSLFALLIVGGMGSLLGGLLVVAAYVFEVKKDKRQEELESFLPSLNCGACGYAGCASYAAAILNDDVPLNKCTPGGPDALARISAYIGVEAEAGSERMVAFVKCKGSRDKAIVKFEYNGIDDCNALIALYGGDKECAYGCLGKGSCIKVCPADAIYKTSDGLVMVDPVKCISCEKCVVICPTAVIQMVPASADYIVACKSLDKGGITKKNCSVGCIGCKICEKKSPDGGFLVENFLATIDFSKTGDRKAASEACPAKCIIPTGVMAPVVSSAPTSPAKAANENDTQTAGNSDVDSFGANI